MKILQKLNLDTLRDICAKGRLFVINQQQKFFTKRRPVQDADCELNIGARIQSARRKILSKEWIILKILDHFFIRAKCVLIFFGN